MPAKRYVLVTHPLSEFRGMVGLVTNGEYPEQVLVRFGDNNCAFIPRDGVEDRREQEDGIIYAIPFAKLSQKRPVQQIQELIEGYAHIGLALELDEDNQVVVLKCIPVLALPT